MDDSEYQIFRSRFVSNEWDQGLDIKDYRSIHIAQKKYLERFKKAPSIEIMKLIAERELNADS